MDDSDDPNIVWLGVEELIEVTAIVASAASE